MQLIALEGLPEINSGDDLPELLANRLRGTPLFEGDIVVVTQKIVSKAEDRFVDLSTVTVSAKSHELAAKVNKDPALVELVLRESDAIVREAPNVLITRHKLGHVMANSGIDASNVGPSNTGKVLLLPANPDASALAIRRRLADEFGLDIAVLISDSFGRPWRLGTVDVAIGVAGMAALIDQRGQCDRDGRVLQVTQIAAADAIAAAAGLIMGEADEGIPVVIVRGWKDPAAAQTSAALLRPQNEDLFR